MKKATASPSATWDVVSTSVSASSSASASVSGIPEDDDLGREKILRWSKGRVVAVEIVKGEIGRPGFTMLQNYVMDRVLARFEAEMLTVLSGSEWEIRNLAEKMDAEMERMLSEAEDQDW